MEYGIRCGQQLGNGLLSNLMIEETNQTLDASGLDAS